MTLDKNLETVFYLARKQCEYKLIELRAYHRYWWEREDDVGVAFLEATEEEIKEYEHINRWIAEESHKKWPEPVGG